MKTFIKIIIGIVVAILVAILFIVIFVIVGRNKCINNFASNFHISQNQAACLYDALKSKKVSNSIIKQFCQSDIDWQAVLKTCSVTDAANIAQAAQQCNIVLDH